MTVRDLTEALGLLRDPTYRAVLRAARSWGMRPSQILGDPQAVVALRVERDDAGRVAALVEPPWSLEDRLFALALQVWEADTCSGCGHQLSESTAAENEFRYRADLPTRCHACTAAGRQASSLPDTVPQPQALRFPVTLIREEEEAAP